MLFYIAAADFAMFFSLAVLFNVNIRLGWVAGQGNIENIVSEFPGASPS